MPTTHLVRATALALVALTALSLTGCEPGSGKNGKKRHKSSSSGYKSSHRNDSTSSGTGSSHRRNSHKHSGTQPRDCTANDLRLTVETVTRPDHHFVVRAENTSGLTCELEGYPRIRFDGVRQAPDVVNENRPVSGVKIRPGAAAYAAVRTAGSSSGSGGTAVSRIEVAVLASNKLDVLGDPARIVLPRGTKVVETAVGYWWATRSDALMTS